MKRLLLIPILCICSITFAQVTINGAGTYTQNFNTLAATGSGITWTDNTTIPNVFSQRTGTGTTYDTGTGSANTGRLYSFGAASDPDRALGSIGSSNATAGHFAHGISFHNTGTTNVGTFTVSYTMEQWRDGGSATPAPQSMTFWYKVSSSAITSLSPNANATWTQVTALTGTSPVFNTTAVALDGNLTANRVTLSNVVIPGLVLAAGEYLMVKWDDPDQTGSDHGLSIDDVTISWSTSCVTTNTINVSTCQTYTVPSGHETYTTSGVYMDTIPNAALCDSILTINLTIKNNTTNSFATTACGSYTVPSGDEVYTISGTYMDTIANAAGCDSILTITLTMTGSITYYQDLDTDGFGNPAVSQTGCSPIPGYVTNADDCDDNNNAIGLGTTWYQDLDTDGFGNASMSQVACTQPTGYVANDTDCDDNNTTIGAASLYYVDTDNDGYGSASATGVSSCTPIAGSVTNNSDCNDNNGAVYPGATEIPNNGIDEDCSGADLNTIGTAIGMYEFTTHTCTTTALNVTTQPTNAVFSAFAASNVTCAAGTDYFNNSDWNTTGTIDLTEYTGFNVLPTNCYGLELNMIKFTHRTSSTAGTPTIHVRSSLDNFGSDLYSKPLTVTGTYVTDTVFLTPAFDNITSSVEFRFYITNMGQTGSTYRQDNVTIIGSDYALPTQTYYADADGDGFGDLATSQTACTTPAGYVLDNTDCNDANDEEFPGAVWYADTDGDGLGDAGSSQISCLQPVNYVSNDTDCDDNNNQVGLPTVYFVDADGDGYGDATDLGTESCTAIAGSVTNADDCDDTDDQVNPGMAEVCDGFDNNCDGQIDEGFTMATYYEDADNDGFGNPNASVQDCTQPTGYVVDNTDCNDASNAVYPGAPDQTGNGIDENCDGVDGVLGIDESILANLSVYPNPGTNAVVLHMNNGWNGFQVTFVSVEGKTIALNSTQISADELEFNTNELISGVYFIRVTSASGTALVRWIKK